MKELSIEEKAKAYDEAIKKAKGVIEQNPLMEYLKKGIEYIFPELGEDEKDKCMLNNIIDTLRPLSETTHSSYAINSMIAWLEKQGQTFTKKDVDDAYLKGICNAKQELEKQGDHKPADKVEPKFKIGDWVIDKQDIVHQIANVIENVTNHTYGYDIVGGGYFNDNTEGVRLWTINDAKDGDVLASNKSIFIFQEEYIAEKPIAYCGLMNGHFLVDGENACWTNERYYPATKEQRDTLFAKMKEAGYEWDADKKELKKIEQKSTNENLTDVGHEYYSKLLSNDDSDNIDEYAYQCAYCMSHDWMKETATWEDVQKAVKLGAEWQKQKPAWSENDVYNSKLILSTISQDQDLSLETKDKLTSWLKSLKERYTWKPSDAQIEALGVATDICSIPEKQYDELNKLYYNLKKLTK